MLRTPLVIGLVFITIAFLAPITIVLSLNDYSSRIIGGEAFQNIIYGRSYGRFWSILWSICERGGNVIDSNGLRSLKKTPSYITLIKDRNMIVVNANYAEIPVFMSSENGRNIFMIYEFINPTIIVKKNTRLKMIVVNIDKDAPHSLAIVSNSPPYPRLMHITHYTIAFPGALTPKPMIGLPPARSNNYPAWLVEFTVSLPGTYYYVSLVPGHAAEGMYGKLIVQNGNDNQ
jgi:rusticyanin